MVNGDKFQTGVVLLDKNIASIAIQVQQSKIEHCNLVHFIRWDD